MRDSETAEDTRPLPLLRLRGLDDDAAELQCFEDYVTCISSRMYILFRKQVRRSVRYASIRRVIVRQGPRYATLALEDADGQVMSISLAVGEAIIQAGNLVSERIYRARIIDLGLTAADCPALEQTLTALHARGLLTDDYFEAKRQELS